ncbi:MAG TPA: dihydroorotase family protein [Woeseiaceae bacterium]|nr:dihydroorotase family protein [Woeseiaceae bacterium]
MTDKKYDTLIRNVKVVRPKAHGVADSDIAILDGRFAEIGPDLDTASARTVVDGKGLLAFPGVVDAHMHTGIYSPLEEDALSESRAAAMGGVTSSLNYMRTGKYYLNKGGSYLDFFPEVLSLSEGRFHVDYAYHLAPMDSRHIGEIGRIVEELGVTSFKIFMFYGGYGLHGRSSNQQDFLMIGEDEKYDMAHFEFVMRGVRKAMQEHPGKADAISLSMHCETAEIMAAYTKIVETEGKLKGLEAYSASRPPHSEGLAICIASYLAHETECLNINLLHLSGRKAMEAAITMQSAFPHIDFRREVTIGHLLLDVNSPCGSLAKVNPPIRPREDVEYLWQAVAEGQVDWVVSDHACCRHELKVDRTHPDDIFLAKSGFGGTEYLLSGLLSEGRKRGLSYNRMAELLSLNPARRYGLSSKGDIAEGLDADLVLVDPDESFVVDAAASESEQGYTPFQGMELTGRVKSTWLRGEEIWDGARIIGTPRGRYLHRPY